MIHGDGVEEHYQTNTRARKGVKKYVHVIEHEVKCEKSFFFFPCI